MSNTVAWRAKPRTSKPSSRQKRNGLFLDKHPFCRCGARSTEAHHDLPRTHPDRNSEQHMQAFCRQCHVDHHRGMTVTANTAIG